ncbi:MAG: TetR family transcriptional regulator [Eubacteriales bacterium]|nr:TetR family transcriptional regulator [Eubacteriales bacterium]
MSQKKDNMKALIVRSFKQLMREQPFEKLTIQRIADRAGIMRSTFYHHFKDKYDLLDWVIQQELVFPAEKGLKNRQMTEALRAMLDNVLLDLPFYKRAIRVVGKNGFSQSVYEHISDLLYQQLTEQNFEYVEEIPLLNARILSNFYAHSFLFVILELLENGFTCSSEEILEAYTYVASHSMAHFWGEADKPDGMSSQKK